MRNNMLVKDMEEQDIRKALELYKAFDEKSFELAFGEFDAVKEYVKKTYQVKDSIFGYNNIRVLIDNDELIGMYIGYDKEPSYVKRENSGVNGLSENFNDTCETQIIDVRMADIEHAAYVDTLAVCEKYRGQGYGTALLQDAKERYGQILLYCDADDERLLKFYRDFGFEQHFCTFLIDENDEIMTLYGMVLK